MKVISDKFLDLNVDVVELGNKFFVLAEIPGINAEDVNVKQVGGFLVIEGVKRKYFSYIDQDSYLNNGCSYGKFKKYIAIPDEYQFLNKQDNISFDNGVLQVKFNSN